MASATPHTENALDDSNQTPLIHKPASESRGVQCSEDLSRSASARRVLAAKAAINAIAKKEEHSVHIPLLTIFNKVMDAMQAMKPEISYGQTDDCLFEVSIEFYVPATFAREQREVFYMVTSDPCITVELAETSAAKSALHCLTEANAIVLKDYSSVLVERYEKNMDNAWATATKIKDVVEYVLDRWDGTIQKVEKVIVMLERKMLRVSTNAGKVFEGIAEHIATFVRPARANYINLKEQVKALEDERLEYIFEITDRSNHYVPQGGTKEVWFSEKDVISFLMNYLGVRQALNINKIVGKNSFKGEVKMALPVIRGVACGGITRVPGSVELSAERAEMMAARTAIAVIERHMNIRVIDANYEKRLEAKSKKKKMHQLEEKYRCLATEIKQRWGSMVHSTRVAKESYSEMKKYFKAPPSDEEARAFVFSSMEVENVYKDCASSYDLAVPKLDAIDI